MQCEIARTDMGRELEFEPQSEPEMGIVIRREARNRHRNALRSREQSLLQAHREAWEPKVPGLRTKADVRRANATVVGCCNRHADNMACDCLANAAEWEFRRGFPATVTLDWPAARDHLDAVLAAAPVTEVTLSGPPEYVTRADGDSDSMAFYFRGRQGHFVSRRTLPDVGHETVCRALLAKNWPQVRAWHLPPAPHYGSDGGSGAGNDQVGGGGGGSGMGDETWSAGSNGVGMAGGDGGPADEQVGAGGGIGGDTSGRGWDGA